MKTTISLALSVAWLYLLAGCNKTNPEAEALHQQVASLSQQIAVLKVEVDAAKQANARLEKSAKDVEAALNAEKTTAAVGKEATRIQIAALEKKVAEHEAQIERAKTGQALAAKASEQEARKKWEAILNQIVLKLERVTNEANNLGTTRTRVDASREEARLKTLSREQESDALSLAYELKAQNFPKFDELERLIKEFASNYASWITYLTSKWQIALMSGQLTKELDSRITEHQTAYFAAIREIKSLTRGY